MNRALVVDDSRAMRLIVSRTVRGLGFDVIEAADGAQALARLGETAVQLALVDWNMPGMNGLELVKSIRAQPSQGELRIVMITTENELAAVQAALDAGADEFLMKPFTAESLRDKLTLVGIEAPGGAS